MRMRKTLTLLLFLATLAARQPIVYFYVIPFDNLKDDPTIEWIASGLSDMVSNKFVRKGAKVVAKSWVKPNWSVKTSNNQILSLSYSFY